MVIFDVTRPVGHQHSHPHLCRYHSIHLPLYTKKAAAEYNASKASNNRKWPVREHPYPVAQTATRLFLSSNALTNTFEKWSQGLGVTVGCTAKQNHDLLPFQNTYIGQAQGAVLNGSWKPGPIEAYVSLWEKIKSTDPNRGWEMELVCRPDIFEGEIVPSIAISGLQGRVIY